MPQYGTQMIDSITAEAGADLSTKQYLFAAIASDGQVDPCGDGVRADGVIYGWSALPTVAGMAITLAVSGVVPVIAGAAIAMGAMVCSDAAGKAVTTASGKQVLGKALGAATGAGSVIPVLLMISAESTTA